MVRLFSAIALSMAAVCCVYSSNAQTCKYRISGTVTDAERHPVTGAVIRLETDAAKGDVTDTNGKFAITGVCPGHTHVICHAMSYDDTRIHLHVTGNSNIDIALTEGGNQGPEVFINGRRTREFETIPQAELKGKALFQERGAALAEALKKLPGLNAIQTGPTISKPMIHGLHSNRVLILNNGVRQEGQQWGSEHAPEIDPFVANRISVIKGAASVRYGADAIGGVVLLEPDLLPVSKGMNGSVYLIGQSNGRMGVASGTLQGKTGNEGVAWRVQGTAKKAGNFSTPHYYLKNTGLEEQDVSAQTSYKHKGFDVEGYYSMFTTRNGIFEGAHAGNLTDLYAAIQRTQPITQSVFSYDIARSYQHTKHSLAKLGMAYHFANENKLELNLARQGDLREEYDISLPYTKDPDILRKPQLSFQLITHSAELVFHRPGKGKLSGNMGLAASTQGNVFRGIRYLIPNFRTYSGGAFVIERYNTGKLTLEAGARYDYRWQRVYQRNQTTLQTYNTTLTFSNPTATVGGIYRFSEHFSATANAGTAWRAPAVNELYIHGVHFSDASYQDGDSTLKAERSLNGSLTLAYNSRKLRLTADVYRNMIGNYIYETPQAQPVTLLSGTFPAFKFTQDNVSISGIDASAQYDVLKFATLQSRATIVRGYNHTTNDWLIYMPADRFENGVVLNLHSMGFMDEPYFSVENVTVRRQMLAPAGLDYAATPAGYSLFNASAGFTARIKKRTVQLDLTVANFTNVAYRDYLDKFRYYADNIGMNFIVRTKFSF